MALRASGTTKRRRERPDLIKSYQNKWVILGQELSENNLRK
jgi:hypothetical protein